MPTRHTVDFEQKAALPRGSTNADYPYAIKASDLMKNFIYGALDIPGDIVEETTGEKGYVQRKLKVPNSGTYILGAINGRVQWIETESCD